MLCSSLACNENKIRISIYISIVFYLIKNIIYKNQKPEGKHTSNRVEKEPMETRFCD
jgi:hypothetical protein